MNSPLTLSVETARQLALLSQRLIKRCDRTSNRKQLLALIKQIGLIQIDPINVVNRSHYLVMLSRAGLYNRADLDALLYPERSVFEQWAHAACLIHKEAYEFLCPVFVERRHNPMRYGREQALGKNPLGVIAGVLDQIRNRGPLGSKDFEDFGNRRRQWWNRKPARVALDVLFYEGQLAVDRRVNFQCLYDLSTRVYGSKVERSKRTLDQYRRWATKKSIACLGVGTIKQIADYYRQKVSDVRESVKYLAARKVIAPARVFGWTEEVYMLARAVPLAQQIESGMHQAAVTSLLSPFDNLIWDRDRTLALFGFNYRTEIYVPPKLRKFGYYVMPILHNGRLVGRADTKIDRKSETLLFPKFHLEAGEKITDELLRSLAWMIHEFAVFHGVAEFVINDTQPGKLKTALLSALRN
jgi:uncharacterized protein